VQTFRTAPDDERKRRMKITILGKFNVVRTTDSKVIADLLEKLGHTVNQYDACYTKPDFLIKKANESDLFIFHDCGIDMSSKTDERTFSEGVMGTIGLLEEIKCKKVMIEMNKIVGMREAFANKIIPVTDLVFLNDDTFIRRHKFDNVYPLHYGATKIKEGKESEKFKCEIAVIGDIYDSMVDTIKTLKKQYGSHLQVFDKLTNEEMADLTKSANIIVHLKGIMDNFYWTEEIYKALACGGFLIFPRLYGLKEEGLEDGTHFAGFTSYENIVACIEFFLSPENGEIKTKVAKNGKDFVMKSCLFENKIKDMINICNQK